MNTCHVIAVHRSAAGEIISVRLAECGCSCLSRAELLDRVTRGRKVRIALLHGGHWRDGGPVHCQGRFLCAEHECGTRDGLLDLPSY